jgi:hypothetical protein
LSLSGRNNCRLTRGVPPLEAKYKGPPKAAAAGSEVKGKGKRAKRKDG